MFSNRSKLTIGVLAAAATWGCSGSKEAAKTEAAEKPAIAVQTIAVGDSEWPLGYEAMGTVRARVTGTLSSKVMGYVREVKVQAGDTVQAGQLLVMLDARDLDTSYRQAEAARNEARSAVPEADNAVAAAKAQLDLAQSTFKRMQGLFAKKSISNQEFDEVSAKLKLAKANHEMALSKKGQLESKIRQADEGVAAAEIMRGYAELRAPFAGTVIDRQVEPGNLAAPGTPLLTIERAGAYRLEVPVEESMLRRVKPGNVVTVEVDALGRSVNGRVSEVVPAVDAASRAFTVKIDLPAMAGLRSGVFGRARFGGESRKVLAIPQGAVAEQGQVRSVLVAENGFARGRLVTIGGRHKDTIEVLTGLRAGEHVIYPIPAGVVDGSRVEVNP